MCIRDRAIRINMYDIGIYYETDKFHIQAEYLYKKYGHSSFDDVHAVNSFVNYDLPLHKDVYKRQAVG